MRFEDHSRDEPMLIAKKVCYNITKGTDETSNKSASVLKPFESCCDQEETSEILNPQGGGRSVSWTRLRKVSEYIVLQCVVNGHSKDFEHVILAPSSELGLVIDW
jgi:hypothetical protein